MRRQIQLAEVLDSLTFAANAQHYRCWPGIVEAYYPPVAGQSPATVDVQIAVQDVRIDKDSGETYFEQWPIIPHVPVAFPRFGGRAVWGPLSKGDDVMMISFDLDPSVFMATGQHAKPVWTGRNHGNFWWAYPGSVCDPNALPDPGDALMVGTPGGPVIAIDGSKVSLGAAGASDAVAVDMKVDAIFSALNTFLGALQTYAGGIKSIVDPMPSPLTAALDLAIGTLQAAIVPVGSATVKCAP